MNPTSFMKKDRQVVQLCRNRDVLQLQMHPVEICMFLVTKETRSFQSPRLSPRYTHYLQKLEHAKNNRNQRSADGWCSASVRVKWIHAPL